MTREEQPGKVSSLEARFERWRRRLGLVAGPLAAVLVLFSPAGLERR